MRDRTGRDRAGDEDEHRARRMWRVLEPVHAVIYFEPEPQQACTALGTKGFWMSYFAQRAAPLGAVPPEIVSALFYNFHPARVARAVPDVWAVAAPQRFLEVRLEAVDAALRRLLGPDVIASTELAEAADIATAAAAAAPTAGRALGAANAALPVPETPHLALWHAQTVLREQRGDGHVAALLTAGLDPVEALVVFAAGSGRDGDTLRTVRGWSTDEWLAGAVRLAGRGLVEAGGGSLTAEGEQLRRDVEARTDALADAAWAAIGDAAAARLLQLVAPWVPAVTAGAFLMENPIGVTPLLLSG